MICPRCGTQSLPEANFCEICGLQLLTPAGSAAAQQQHALPLEQGAADALSAALPSPPWFSPVSTDVQPVAASAAPRVRPAEQELPPRLPSVASGWTFGGFVPFGLYAFMNGMPTWGWVALVCQLLWFVPLLGFAGMLAYAIYVGAYGKQLAWRSRRFTSINQYQATMQAWNTWGAAMLITGALLYLMTACACFAAFSEPGSGGLY